MPKLHEVMIMDNTDIEYLRTRRIYTAVFHIALFSLFLYLLFSPETQNPVGGRSGHMRDFSEDWTVNGAASVNLDQFAAADYGGSATLSRALPESLDWNDQLCFTTANLRFTVSIDGVEVYSFDRPENLTGKGYGIAYHSVNLSPEMAGKTVVIEGESVFENHKGGRLYQPLIGSDAGFRYFLAGRNLISILFSAGMLFVGVMLILIYAFLPKKQRMRREIVSLGAVAFIIGLWSTNDTGILRLLTGNVVVDRVLDHALLHLLILPLALYISANTKERQTRYLRMILALTLLDIGCFLLLRYGFGLDMAWLSPILAAYYVLSFTVLGAMFVSDSRYRRRNNITVERKLSNIGVAAMTVSIFLDVAVYFMGVRSMQGRGFFMRFGFVVFVALIIIQTIRWWITDRTSVNRDRFVNRILQYAVSASDPDTSIRAMLEYLCTELHADRAYIFEEMPDGTFDNTYEWCREGVTAEIGNLKGLPYEGVVDTWYNEYKKSNNILIYDIEEYRSVSEGMYNVLKPQGIQTLVTGPMEANGRYIGFFGVDNPPPDAMREISEIIRLLSFIFAQLVLHRDEQKRLMRYSYYDAMTGCRNRRALEEFEKQRLDPAKPYGFVMCDINGLKAANDTLGHEAGDAMIVDVSQSLMKVFGADNVYRTGGDEFVAYAQREDPAAFEADMAQLHALLAEKKRSAAVGAVFRANGDPDYKKAKSEADALMYEDKRKYYQGRNDRRGS
ncbi:MAG: GGDEF domain-containing protein [Ruminococcaceae bacterium]|nr:GGDEF domain-containing protein [Oscillospiraceae bacterium]